jgi:DNA-binding transcriptional ArsR family regulator
MKLALEILNREIAQRKLANKHKHLRKEICTKEIEELESVVNLLSIPIVSVSLLDTVDQLIELYEERLTRANRNRNYIEAHNNQFGIDVLDHLKAVIKHNNER